MTLRILLPILLVFGQAPAAAAQDAGDLRSGAGADTRTALSARLAALDSIANLPATAEPERARVRLEAAYIRERLEHGDFPPGIAIALSVDGEEVLTDTFTVLEGRVLRLPLVGDIPLDGTLRSELEPRLAEPIGRFIREPRLRARPLLRLAVLGEVSAPGYYWVAPNATLGDALMLAGGPSRDAKLDDLKVERDGQPLWEKDRLRRALAEARTLEQMDVRGGDRILVPQAASFFEKGPARILLIALPPLVYGASRIF